MRKVGLAILIVLSTATSSAAAPITWQIEGVTRTFTSDNPERLAIGSSLGVAVGAPVSGRLIFESTTPANSGSCCLYVGALLAFDLAIGSYSFALDLFEGDGLNRFNVLGTTEPDYYPDLYFVFAIGTPDTLFPAGGPPFGPLPAMQFQLDADLPGVIPNFDLPTDPPALSALRPFAIEDWTLTSPAYGTGIQVFGSEGTGILIELTRLERVPEPMLLALLAPFGCALVAIRRR